VDALDQAGNASHTSVTYSVQAQQFTFTGFFSPLENAPVFNRTKPGSTVPLKFSLGGDFGLSIFAPGFPRVDRVVCETGVNADGEGAALRADGGLRYDSVTGRYVYEWKTRSDMAGACWRLTMQFTDGTSAFALFKIGARR
jgi:hypothetical protein